MRISDWLWPRWKHSNPKLHLTERPAGPDPLPARTSCPSRTTGRFMLLAMGLTAAVSVASGCNPTLMERLKKGTPSLLSGEIPPFKLDSKASMVVYEGNVSPDQADADDVRDVLASLLQNRYGRRGVTPARFRLHVHVSYWWWVFILCVDTQPAGCPTGYTSARTTLELQVGEQMFTAHGEGSGYGGFYYNKLTGIDSAVGEAIGAAVGNLTAS